jgi:hypothetical protein
MFGEGVGSNRGQSGLGAHVTGAFAMMRGETLLVCVAGGQGGFNGGGTQTASGVGVWGMLSVRV